MLDQERCWQAVCERDEAFAGRFVFTVRSTGNDEWQLAPAFDILPGDGMNGYHTTSINESIEPTKQDLIAVAEKAGLQRTKAIAMMNEMEIQIMTSSLITHH